MSVWLNLSTETAPACTVEDLNDQMDNVKESLKVTRVWIRLPAERTLKQSGSAIWHEQQTGRITASMAHSVLHTEDYQRAPSSIKTFCCADARPLNTPAILWGGEKEPDVFSNYKDSIASTHDCMVWKIEMKTCISKPFVGALPIV